MDSHLWLSMIVQRKTGGANEKKDHHTHSDCLHAAYRMQ